MVQRLASPEACIVRFGVFELNVRTRELRRRGIKVRLPDQAFQILQLLLERPSEVVTREELRQRPPAAEGVAPTVEPAREGVRVRRVASVAAAFLVLGSAVIGLLGVRGRYEGSSSAPPAQVRVSGLAVVNPGAHALSTEGITRLGGFSYEALLAGVSYLERAIAIQPDFAHAHAGLATTWLQFLYVGPMSPDEVLPKGKRPRGELSRSMTHWQRRTMRSR